MATNSTRTHFAIQARARQARTRRELRGETRFRYAPRVPWEEHVHAEGGLSEVWMPGQHVAIIAPTDWGKTHLALKGLVPLWPREFPWLMVDVKGRDPIIEGWGHRVGKLPRRFMRNREDDQHWRLVLPHVVEQTALARQRVIETLRVCWQECGGKPGSEEFQGWVIHINEAAALAGRTPPDLNLEPWLKWLYQRGRPHITAIAETQRPAGVPRAMYEMASHFYLGGPVDDQSVKRMAEVGGDTDNIVRILRQLREPEFLYFRRRGRKMEIVTAPA